MSIKNIYLRDLSPGLPLDDLFVLAESRLQQSRNGPYWALTLKDNSGSAAAKIWSPIAQQYAELNRGEIVRVQGSVETYREQLQIVVRTLEIIPADQPDLDMGWFIPQSEIAPKTLLESLLELHRKHLKHKPWIKLCKDVLGDPQIRDKLLAAPGAKSIHHAHRGGLLEHTLGVCRVVLGLCDLYPELDREILLCAASFHDLGKIWELESGLSTDYTDEGRLLGHIVIGLRELEPFLKKSALAPELALHFRHLIASHHGELEYGSPKRPKTTEAMILHFADQIDAKINTTQTALEEEPAGEWSAFIPSLGRQIFKPASSPQNGRRPDKENRTEENPERKKRQDDDRPCLLSLKE